MLDLLVNSLRMRPDRILVGEIRRQKEAQVLLEAMHTGHSVYGTIHANNADETIIRLTNPPIEIPKPLISAISLIVVQNRNRRTGKRRTLQVAEVLPNGDVSIVLRLNVQKDTIEQINKPIITLQKLELYTGLTEPEIMKDLQQKKRILKWMVDKGIEDVHSIGLTMSKILHGKARADIEDGKINPLIGFLVQSISAADPHLKRKLRMAKILKTVETYLAERIKTALLMSVGLTILSAFLILKSEISPFAIIFVFLMTFLFFLFIFVKGVDAVIHKRAKEIDKEVLFAGRFLIVKLNAGKPLVNALVDASNAYGVANKFFKEIVRDIDLGTPVEEALESASRYTPSKKFRSILFQITNAIKIGVDVSKFLEATLDEISLDQLMEIQKYGKKLNGITMFYMLLAIVVPSLGLTLFILVASLIGLDVNLVIFSVIIFMLLVLEFIFISVFKSIRPNLNI
ncbi:MAG: Flp pilus assembly complex ATPase component TadA [Nitrosarchaeum sp.]|nr:Flp pilus assembly complex ATPase component TadA [Nitrosarchaeum sp.]